MSSAAHGLPGVLGEIADLVGIEAAVEVAKKVGGTRAYISRKPDADNWLVKAVGPERAAVIVEHFTTGRTGVELDFPIGPGGTYNKQQRHRAQIMKELAAKGASTTEIARQVGITGRAVQMFKAGGRSGRRGQGTLDL